LAEPSFHLVAVFAVVLGALTAFALERWRPELTALGTLVALLLLFELAPLQTPRGRLGPS